MTMIANSTFASFVVINIGILFLGLSEIALSLLFEIRVRSSVCHLPLRFLSFPQLLFRIV